MPRLQADTCISLKKRHRPVYLPRGIFLPEQWLRREFRTIYLQMLGRAYRKGQLILQRQFAAIREPEVFQAWTDKLAALDRITHARPVGQASDPDSRIRTIGYLARHATGVAMTGRRVVRQIHRSLGNDISRSHLDPATNETIYESFASGDVRRRSSGQSARVRGVQAACIPGTATDL